MNCSKTCNSVGNDNSTCSCNKSSSTVNASLAFTILVLLISLIPFFNEVLMSIKQYSPVKGLFSSPYIGFANYKNFFYSPYFSRLLSNTISQSFMFGLFLFLLSSIFGGIVVASKPKGILVNAMITLTLIPVFIPDVVYLSWFINLPLPVKPFIMSNIALWYIPLIRAIKYFGIPVLITSIINDIGEKNNVLLPLQVGACFSLLSLMFFTVNDITITHSASNPLIYQVIDSFNLYTYRSGLVQGEYSYASSVSVISRLLCIISVGIFFIPFRYLVRKLFSRDILNNDYFEKKNITVQATNDEKASVSKPIISTLIALVVMFIIAIIPFIQKDPKIFDIEAITLVFQNSDANIAGSFMLYFIIALTAAFINVVLSAILAYPLVCGGKNQKRGSTILILIIAISASVPISIGSYIFFRNIGLINTIYAVLFSLISPIASVWALVAIANSQGVPENAQYIEAISKPSIALVLIQLVYNLNNFLPSLIYISDRKLYSPILIYREIAITGAKQLVQYDIAVFWYGILLSIIPVGIIAALRIGYNKTWLLSILGMSQRR